METKKTLIIAPNAGFCNRLRSMVSAIYLSEKLEMNIEHLWIGMQYNCYNGNIQNIHDKSFEYFFEEKIKRCDYTDKINKVRKVYTEWFPNISWHKYQSYGQKMLRSSVLLSLHLVNEEMDATEDFLIETSYINNLKITKQDKFRIYNNFFTPRANFLDEISKINEIDENTIGIAIRKGDFKKYFPETQIDDEIILKWIKSMNCKIFFCSDDREYTKKMRNIIKNSIIPNFNVSEDDEDFLEFILLSKCVKIYGTEKSSFSEEASYFGGTEYIPLTKKYFDLNVY